MYNNLKEAVHAGATDLDVVVPGWEDKIDFDTLDMRSSYSCILGQVFGAYGAAYDFLPQRPGEYHGMLRIPDTVGYAFASSRAERYWRDEVLSRKTARKEERPVESLSRV